MDRNRFCTQKCRSAGVSLSLVILVRKKNLFNQEYTTCNFWTLQVRPHYLCVASTQRIQQGQSRGEWTRSIKLNHVMTFKPYLVVVSKWSDCSSNRMIFGYFGQLPLLSIMLIVCGHGHQCRFAAQLVGPLHDI